MKTLWEMRGGYGYCGYGGSFGSKDAGAQGYRLPVVLGEEGDLFGGPAAFGAYGDCVVLTCGFGGCCFL